MSHFVILTDPDTGAESAYYPEHSDGQLINNAISSEPVEHYPVARCHMVGDNEDKAKFALLTETQSKKLAGNDFPTAQGQMAAYMDQIFKGVFPSKE